ncbi:MAG: helix-hairpin-helix domain-containing protein [Planctomycetaceae bacterium]
MNDPDPEPEKSSEIGGDSPPALEQPLPLTRTQQVLVLLVMGALVLSLVLHWARLQGWGLTPVEIDRPAEHVYDYKIEINSATWVEWIQLKGIGKPTAQKIIADREQNGPFKSIDDLIRVNGIGEIKLEQIRPWLRIDLPVTESKESDSSLDE